MRSFAAVLGLVLLFTLPVAAFARTSDAATVPTSDVSLAQAGGVAIIDFAFSPAYVAVPAGSTVSWYNGGGVPHTVTANTGAFASGVLNPGAGYSATPWTPGAYSYFCEIHPGMVGTVEVY